MVLKFDKNIIVMILKCKLYGKEAKRRGLRVAEEVFADRVIIQMEL